MFSCLACVPLPASRTRQVAAVFQEKKPSIGIIIEQLGFGLAQIRAGLVGGGIWIADGSELLLISSVTRAVSDEWHLGPMQRGFIVTIVYVGVCFGNIASGPLADSCGRRS